MLLEIRNVSKRYGEQVVLDHVSMSCDGGSIVGLLGPNGAGKSTLMRIVTGFLSADEGEVLLDGCVPSLVSAGFTGYLPEHNPLYLDMYVREYLDFVMGLYGLGDRRRRCEEVIAEVGLGRECHKRVGQLSKGFRQRVGVAAAIVHDPRVLVLDEPMTGLDPNQLVGMRELVRCLGERRLVLLSTHVMQEVEAVCDDVVVLSRGRVVAEGCKDDLVREFGSMESLFHEVTV